MKRFMSVSHTGCVVCAHGALSTCRLGEADGGRAYVVCIAIGIMFLYSDGRLSSFYSYVKVLIVWLK